MAKRKPAPTPMTIDQASYWVRHQQQWIQEHGSDLAGYVARYGPFPCRACGGSGLRDTVPPSECGACDKGTYTYGDGGPAIYAADTAALAEFERQLTAANTRATRRAVPR